MISLFIGLMNEYICIGIPECEGNVLCCDVLDLNTSLPILPPSLFPFLSNPFLPSHSLPQVIGSNNVAVPTHLFKVILAEREHTSPLTPSQSSPPLSQPLSPLTPSQSSPSQSQPLTVTLGVFVIPNKPLGDVSLSQFQVSLDNLETISGIKFHSKLDRSQVRSAPSLGVQCM